MLIPVYNSLLQVSHNLSNGFSKEQPIQIQSLLLGNFFTFSLGRHNYYHQPLSPKCEGTEVSKMVIHVWAARYAHVGTINLQLARVHYSLSLSPPVSSYPSIVNNVKHELNARCNRGFNAYCPLISTFIYTECLKLLYAMFPGNQTPGNVVW